MNWPWSRSDRGGAQQSTPPVIAPIENNVSLSDLNSWSDLFDWYGANSSGKVVNFDTAMQSSAVYACVRLLAGIISMLPLNVYKREVAEDGEETRTRRNNHPVARFLRVEPEPATSAMVFWETLVWHLLLRGNGYARIHRAGAQVAGLEPIPAGGASAVRKNGRLIYTICDYEGHTHKLDQDDVLHLPCFGWTGTRALSPISYAAQNSVGVALAADDHAAMFYGGGGGGSLSITYPKKVTSEMQRTIRAGWRQHGIDNAHLPRIIPEGGKVEQIGITPQDAQLIEARRYQVTDVCRFYGVPPILLGESEKNSSWGSGIEQVLRGFERFTLGSHLQRITQEINRKLFPRTPFYAEFNVEAFLKLDVKSRAEAYKAALGGNQAPGYMTQNEIRQRENLEKMDDARADQLHYPPENSASGATAEDTTDEK